jgi:hypothetical protein
VVRAEGNEITLRQYQADGATGLARGGIAVEDAVVVEVLVPRPVTRTELVKVRAWTVVGKDKDGKDILKEATGQAPYDPAGMRIRLENLQEGDWRWGILPIGPEKASEKVSEKPAEPGQEGPKPVYLSAPGDKPDFSVSRGITEPVAKALAGDYLFAFEAVSVLLLAALVGAAFLARKEVRE